MLYIIRFEDSTSSFKVQVPTPTHSLYILLAILLFALFLLQSYRVFNNGSSEELGRNKSRKHRVARSLNDNEKGQLTTALPFIDDFLEVANKYRALHGAATLDIDYKLAVDAEQWAKHLAEESDKQGKPILVPSYKYITGESIFAAYSKDPAITSGTDVAVNWYNDCSFHSWDSNSFLKESARFSQLIWKDSEWMGIAKAQATKLGITIVVARYLPAGNWIYSTSFKNNVFPLSESAEQCYKPSSMENITTVTVNYPIRNASSMASAAGSVPSSSTPMPASTVGSVPSGSGSITTTTEKDPDTQQPQMDPIGPIPEPVNDTVTAAPVATPCPYAVTTSTGVPKGRSIVLKEKVKSTTKPPKPKGRALMGIIKKNGKVKPKETERKKKSAKFHEKETNKTDDKDKIKIAGRTIGFQKPKENSKITDIINKEKGKEEKVTEKPKESTTEKAKITEKPKETSTEKGKVKITEKPKEITTEKLKVTEKPKEITTKKVNVTEKLKGKENLAQNSKVPDKKNATLEKH